MLKWVSFLGVGAAMGFLVGGCATSAGGIAADYGTLGGRGFHQVAEKRLAQMIESGEADRMVAEGKTSQRTYVKGVGEGAVLVTEHRIQGMVYRVEVRNRINPVMDILTTNVRQVNYGPADRSLMTVCPIERAEVLQALAGDSFDAQGQVAYRAYVGSDGEFHPVRVAPGEVPDWSERSAIDLIVRTDRWDTPLLHLRGCRPDGKDASGRLQEPDGRWVVLMEGTAVPMTKTFYNLELHPLLKCMAHKQAYDTNLFRVP